MRAHPRRNWPALPYSEWRETCTALHLWSQIVGKYRLAHAPWINHSWHATLYVTPRGVTTGPVPDPGGTVAITLDFCDHQFIAESAGGRSARFPLEPMSVATFFERATRAIATVGGSPSMHDRPNEVPEAVRFPDDTRERPYDSESVERFHQALLQTAGVFERSRTSFLGKVSPVHLFWGAFDLAVTRFSGRRAPLHPGGMPNLPDSVTREAYSHEVSSAGFWPGGGGADEAMFYSYAWPEPQGFRERPVPDGARYDSTLGEFLLPYETVRTAGNPEEALSRFLRSTYDAAAHCGGWDRAALECDPGRPRVPRAVEQTKI